MNESNKWNTLSRGMEEYASFLDMEDEHLEAREADDKPGGSNAGKYKTKGPFCGPALGNAKRSPRAAFFSLTPSRGGGLSPGSTRLSCQPPA